MRFAFRLLAVAALLGLAALALLGVFAPWSPSGWFAIGASATGAVALLVRERAARRGLLAVACSLVTIVFWAHRR